jgi:hypothetical protein
MARQDIAGLLTGMPSKRPDPMGMGVNSEQQRLAFGAQRAQGMERGLRSAMGQGPTTSEQLQMAMAQLDLSKPDDLRKLAQIQQATGDLAGAAQTATRIKQMQEQVKAQELKQSQGAVFASYVDSTFNNPELTKLAAGGVLTPNNLDSFIKDTSNATILKGSTFTVRDEKDNNFTMIPTLNNKTGELENSYSPIGNAPSAPIGKTVVTGGEFAQTAGEVQRQKIETKGLETQEANFQKLKVAATDSIPTLNASKNNLDRATALLDSVSTGGPVNLAGTGLENFFGIKGANKAELEIILGQEMFKSLKPLFGGVISEGERQAIVDIYANLKKGNIANKGILKRLKQELNDGIVKANLYQKATNYEEFKLAVKQMFPEGTTSKRRVIVFGQRDGENNE